MPAQSRFTDRQFNRSALLGVLAGFVLLVAAFAAVLVNFSANQQSAQLVRHTYQVTDQLSRLDVQVERAESGRRGVLLAQNAYRYRVYRDNARLIPQTLDRIDRLVTDNPRQSARLDTLKRLAGLELSDLRRSVMLASSGKLEQARAEFTASSANSVISQIRSMTAAMRQTELELLDQRGNRLDRTLGAVRIVIAIAGLLLLLVGAGTFLIMRRYTRTLAVARDRLHVLNTDLEGAVAERTADLQRANDEIQRFAYIVSHDLRSPLVNILGFTAELEQTNKSLGSLLERAEQEAPHIITDDSRAAREDLPEAIGFIRTSTQKMDRLINAILRLSREGRRTLTPEHLPMAQVCGEIVGSLEHRLIETGATVTIEDSIPDTVSDRVAIEQIFSNLIENAIKYQQPGRPGVVKIRGHAKNDRVIYEVEDNGRGIDRRDHERVFDLFRRSGTQDQPGEGIGLAHVRALAYRLGGFIDLKSELGEGATFQVNLPKTYAEQGISN